MGSSLVLQPRCAFLGKTPLSPSSVPTRSSRQWRRRRQQSTGRECPRIVHLGSRRRASALHAFARPGLSREAIQETCSCRQSFQNFAARLIDDGFFEGP